MSTPLQWLLGHREEAELVGERLHSLHLHPLLHPLRSLATPTPSHQRIVPLRFQAVSQVYHLTAPARPQIIGTTTMMTWQTMIFVMRRMNCVGNQILFQHNIPHHFFPGRAQRVYHVSSTKNLFWNATKTGKLCISRSRELVCLSTFWNVFSVYYSSYDILI
jgi:hypothetical protein